MAQTVKHLPANAGDPGSIPGLGRSPGEGTGNLQQYSRLENSTDGGVWWTTVYWFAKSQTRLKDFTYTTDRLGKGHFLHVFNGFLLFFKECDCHSFLCVANLL